MSVLILCIAHLQKQGNIFDRPAEACPAGVLLTERCFLGFACKYAIFNLINVAISNCSRRGKRPHSRTHFWGATAYGAATGQRQALLKLGHGMTRREDGGGAIQTSRRQALPGNLSFMRRGLRWQFHVSMPTCPWAGCQWFST